MCFLGQGRLEIDCDNITNQHENNTGGNNFLGVWFNLYTLQGCLFIPWWRSSIGKLSAGALRYSIQSFQQSRNRIKCFFFFSLSLLLNNTVGWVKGKQYFRLLLSSVLFFFFSLSFSKGETFCRDCFTVNRGDCPRESCRSFLSDEKGSITLNALTGPTSTVHQSPLNSTCSTVAFQVLGALMRGDTFVAMFCT